MIRVHILFIWDNTYWRRIGGFYFVDYIYLFIYLILYTVVIDFTPKALRKN